MKQHEELRQRLVRRAWELMDEIDAGLHSGAFEVGARGSEELREIRAALDRMDARAAGESGTQPGGPR